MGVGGEADPAEYVVSPAPAGPSAALRLCLDQARELADPAHHWLVFREHAVRLIGAVLNVPDVPEETIAGWVDPE